MTKKKLLIAYRECGFGDNLLNAANLWLYAKKTNNALAICWYSSIYLESKVFANAFYHFFEFPDNLQGVPIIKANPIFFYYHKKVVGFFQQKQWKTKETTKPTSTLKEKLVSKIANTNNCLIIKECLPPSFMEEKALKPFFDALSLRKDLQQKLNNFAKKHFQKKKVIGIHIRYYSTDLEHSDHTKYWLDEAVEIKQIEKTIEKEVSRLKEPFVLFLCTDSNIIQRHFLEKNDKNLIVYFNLKENERKKGKELHASNLSVQTAENSLIEMFLLAKCHTLIRNTNSWFNFYGSIYAKRIINVHESQNN